MVTISISDKVIRAGGVVVLSRNEYEQLVSVAGKSVKTLGERLAVARVEEERGELIGPFRDARSLMKSLRQK